MKSSLTNAMSFAAPRAWTSCASTASTPRSSGRPGRATTACAATCGTRSSAAGAAWGRLELDDERLALHVLGGDLRLDTVTARGVRLEPAVGGTARAGESLTFVVPA